ncbi:DUF6973 domain-containing protein [Serratia fonticola]|uniref:DUF6973 domain-containing protein n=1 Tax=Serratia fonticola TaxID=47917 RepID=UPI00358DC6C6
MLFAAKHPLIALDIGTIEKGSNNISTVAHRFASTGTGENALQYTQPNGSTEGTEVNAFRHTVWQAGITSNHGVDIAKEVGDSHEVNPNAFINSNRTFNTMADADQVTDLLNNQIGRSIGEGNSGRNMQELSSSVLDEFHQNGLYAVKENADGKYVVEKTTLSKEKYNYLKEHYSTLDKNGNSK